MRKPHYPLEEVKALGLAKRVRLLKTRALEPIMDAFPAADTATKATALAADAIAQLTASAFSESVEQSFVTCDVYGVTLDGRGFYVKLSVDVDIAGDELVVCLSFHILQRPLRTNGGMVNP